MEKIDTSKSVIFGREVGDIKASVEYLNKEGYFSNSKDFSDYEKATLDKIHVASFMWYPYEYIHDCNWHSFSYFIPKDKVVFESEEEPKKKQYRPFRYMSEFLDKTCFKVGEVITIKRFGDQEYEDTCLFSGFRVVTNTEPQITTVVFGNNRHTFDELKNCFKYYKNGEWLPFGIEE